MVPSVEKKVALVTGGGTGVGKAVCLALAQLDYSIAVNYSRSELDAQSVCSTIRKSGGKAIPVRCDVGKSSDVQHMVNTILDVFGRVDCLVCNAGTTHFVDYLDLNKLSDEERVDELKGKTDEEITATLKQRFSKKIFLAKDLLWFAPDFTPQTAENFRETLNERIKKDTKASD